MQVWKTWSPIIAEGYPKRMEMLMICWPQCKKEQDFLAKIDRSLSIYLPSQLYWKETLEMNGLFDGFILSIVVYLVDK